MGSFVHLHVHSHYSLLNSTIRIPALVERIKDAGMTAVALTDMCNMFGAVQFVKACEKAGVKPILGSELLINDEKTNGRNYHLVVIAKNATGFTNLRSLVTKVWLESPDGQASISHATLAAHASGLIALSGCLGGEIPQAILRQDYEGALSAARWYDEIFGRGNFYLELESNELAEQDTVNEALKEIARETSLPLVATSNAHYLDRSDAVAHAMLVAIALKGTLDIKRLRSLPLRSYHLAHPDEMVQRFRSCPEAIENTVRIADEVDNGLLKTKSKWHFPVFETPEGEDSAAFLQKLARQGLEQRLAAMRRRGEVPDEKKYFERLEYELGAIQQTGFVTYYLIVWDFVHWAKQKGIPVGPGRGSGAGSLVAYALGITDLDPLRYDLLFERFLNPERVSPPDFDIDFCERRRDEVIEYVRNRYGHDRCGQIITFSTLGAKGAIRDTARVLGMPLAEVDRLSKLIPKQPDITIEKAVAMEPRLAAIISEREGESLSREVLELAKSLEGLTRQPGRHPAGIVIADRPIADYVPLYRMDDGTVVTQFAMEDLDAVGLIKFDLLGLTALTVIEDCVRMVRARHDPNFTIQDIPIDDKPTYELLSSGHTRGVFQLESAGITDLVRRLRPDCFEDLIALLAMYRPGPLGGGMVSDFLDRKHGLKPVTYPLAELEPILAETYGIILYQEQVMRIASTVAGYSLGQADLLRRAMGKKKPEELEMHREPFVRGATARGVSRQMAQSLFDTMEKFASYGFNKSHSAAYALLTYRTAYLKAHFPAEFLCATLSAEKNDQDKVMTLLREAKALGIRLLLPDVNRSGADFTVEDVVENGKKGAAIRFGLGGIKGVGDATVEAILEARKTGPFQDIDDFLARVDLRKVNRRVLEALVRSGALDCFGYSRRALMESLDKLVEKASGRKTTTHGQMGLLFESSAKRGPEVPSLPEWPALELLAGERATIGYYVSGHPLDAYKEKMQILRVQNISDVIANGTEEESVTVAGIVVEKSEKHAKSGGLTVLLALEDTTGRIECRVFPNVYSQWSQVADTQEPLLVRGTLRYEVIGDEERLRLVVNSVERLESAEMASASAVEILLDLSCTTEEHVARLRQVLSGHKGNCPVHFLIVLPGVGSLRLRASAKWTVEPSERLLKEVEASVGPGIVRFL